MFNDIDSINHNLLKNMSYMSIKEFNWKSFWKEYRNIDCLNEDDLFFQVGKTINGRPISKQMFQDMIEDVVANLTLKPEDTLLEMCCGNGLLTQPLSDFVSYVYAFDFTEHLIDTAIKERFSNKITYTVGDAKADFFSKFDFHENPNKFLMNDSLGYFTFSELLNIIERIMDRCDNFSFYITGVPDEDLKWNFYNTEERKTAYLVEVAAGDITAKGIGYWWRKQEFEAIAQKLNISCWIVNQPENISNYRSNVLFSK
jgi:hypothetical protein